MTVRTARDGAVRFAATIGTAVRMMFRADRRSASLALALSVLIAALPPVTLVVQRAVVDRVAVPDTIGTIGPACWWR